MKIAKVLSAIAAMGIVFATTAISSSASATYSRNNWNNRIDYDDYTDLSLLNYTCSGGPLGKVKTCHVITYDGDGTAECIPCNYSGRKNKVYWYSECRKNNGKGKISDSYEKTVTVSRGKSVEYDLSEGMGWLVRDRSITYFRFDVWPTDGHASTEAANKSAYSRRSSTDVY